MPLFEAICRNVTVNGRRTSLRLEAQVWESLEEICGREGLIMNQLCSKVETLSGGRGSANLSSALRAHVLHYFRSAATENGHRTAGHGTGDIVLPEPEPAKPAPPRTKRRRDTAHDARAVV